MINPQTRLHTIIALELEEREPLTAPRRLVRRVPHREGQQFGEVRLDCGGGGAVGEVADEDDEALFGFFGGFGAGGRTWGMVVWVGGGFGLLERR